MKCPNCGCKMYLERDILTWACQTCEHYEYDFHLEQSEENRERLLTMEIDFLLRGFKTIDV